MYLERHGLRNRATLEVELHLEHVLLGSGSVIEVAQFSRDAKLIEIAFVYEALVRPKKNIRRNSHAKTM